MSLVLLWFLVGIVFFAVELALPGFIIFFFGIGAWCAALVLYFYPLSASGQLMVFLTTGIISLLLLRAWLRGIFFGGSRRQNDSVNVQPIHSTGVITEAVFPPARGRVKYGGSFWQAEADEPISTGTVVTIVQQNDLLVHVEPVEKEKS